MRLIMKKSISWGQTCANPKAGVDAANLKHGGRRFAAIHAFIYDKDLESGSMPVGPSLL